MLVQDLVKLYPPICTEDMPLEKVYELLASTKDGMVVVIESETHRTPIGVVNANSICEQIIRRKRDPRGLAAGNVLDASYMRVEGTAPLSVCVERPNADTVVVVDENRRFAGVVKRAQVMEMIGRLERAEKFAPQSAVAYSGVPIMGLA
ncbi:MAG: CBS domain-containing protein [Blastocatellia bacterium]|nr:CBS domain-containing protein [Blastocatellia bacterium]